MHQIQSSSNDSTLFNLKFYSEFQMFKLSFEVLSVSSQHHNEPLAESQPKQNTLFIGSVEGTG